MANPFNKEKEQKVNAQQDIKAKADFTHPELDKYSTSQGTVSKATTSQGVAGSLGPKETGNWDTGFTASEATVSDRPEPVKEINEGTDPITATKEASKPTFDNDEVLPLLDMILNNGYAIEEHTIRNSSFIIRTRFSWEDKAIYKHLEATKPQTAISYQREFTLISMAASLVKYGNTVFEPKNTGDPEALAADIKKRYDFLNSLNSVITDVISMKLDKFDEKQRYIIENFDNLLKAF